MKKILVVGGALQSANMGINALTKGLLNGVYNISDDVQIKMLSFVIKEKCIMEFTHGTNTYVIEAFPSSVKKNLKILAKQFFLRGKGRNSCSLYNMYTEADIILDLSAGDSFTDIYGLKRFIYTSLPKLVTIAMKKRLVLMPQTIGPFNNIIVKAVSKYIVNKCYMNYSRDIVSYNYLLSELKVPKARAALSPDMAFNMLPSDEESINDIMKVNNRNRAPLVGINISALLFNGGYTSKNQFGLIIDYKALIARVIQFFIDINCNIVLVPHVLCSGDLREDDYTLCRRMADQYKTHYPYIYTFKKEYLEDQIKSIIGKCDFFIGSRMHSCIGAISMGVPTVPIAYSRKFIGIWDMLGLKECIADAQTMEIDEIMKKIEFCYDDRKNIKGVLNSKLKNVNEEINSMFHVIMSC